MRAEVQERVSVALLELRRRREAVELEERSLVAAAREAGLFWDDIAYALGLSKSTVYYRYGDKPQRKSRRLAPVLRLAVSG